MTMLIRNATLPDGRTGIDVLVEADRIKAVGPNLPPPEGVSVIEAGGLRLTAGLSSMRISTWTRR